MDRDLVFAVLVAALCGGALMAVGWWPMGSAIRTERRFSERRMLWRLWLPFLPSALVLAVLVGWLLVEPANAEPAPKALMLTALPFALIFGRAVWRATQALTISTQSLTIGTVGFFRPRIVVSPQFAAAIDRDALAAALTHERAHVAHRDPLRLWIVQFATELQWPAPAAVARLRSWKAALEIARDDEARSCGIAGPDLAAAILAAIRLSPGTAPVTAATLADETFIRERVARLLQPLEAEASVESRLAPILLLVSLGIPLAVMLGVRFGERLIGSLLRVT